MRNRLREWGEEHCEGGVALASKQINSWEFGIWLDWTCFGLGLDAEREYGSPLWPDRLHLSASLGPLSLGALRSWNEPTR